MTPRLAVLSIVARGDQVLLVQRRNPPDAGLWGFPGGKVDFGETVFAAAERELLEETGVTARATQILGTHELILPEFHYFMVGVLCRYEAGTPMAADDAMAARWLELNALDQLELSADVARTARAACAVE